MWPMIRPMIQPEPAKVTCADCGVEEGSPHIWGCSREECPFCREFLDGCGCHTDLSEPQRRDVVDLRGRIWFGKEINVR